MSLEAFASSRPLTLGVELELQLVNTHDYDLTPAAGDLLRLISEPQAAGRRDAGDHDQHDRDVRPASARTTRRCSRSCARSATRWSTRARGSTSACAAAARTRSRTGASRRIYDKPRFHQLSELYGYLSKQFTVFGQHVHIGCPGPDQALVLLHGLSRFIPHLIALSASSPFVQGTDTGFDSARLNSVFAFPLSGRAPFMLRWEDFERYFDEDGAHRRRRRA